MHSTIERQPERRTGSARLRMCGTVLLLALAATPAQAGPAAGGVATDGVPAVWRPAPADKIRPSESWHTVAAVRYTVAPGDTLYDIAETYGVSVANIRRWNRLDGDHLRPGQQLVIYAAGPQASRQRIQHTVRSGETGLGIALRYRVSLDDLGRWNRSTDLDRLRIGQKLYVYIDSGGGSATDGGLSDNGEPRAIGSPSNGRLSNGLQLESGPGIIVRDPSEAWGMPATLDAIRRAYARLVAVYPDSRPVHVGDLSRRGGGPLRPHRSHQNGLDADVAYYTTEPGPVCILQDVPAEQLDVQRQWYLFRLWLEWDVLVYVFVDYELQRVLYEYAQAEGATEEQLERWFQYPRGPRTAAGVLRHARGHRDHYHVRFRQQAAR